MTPLHIIYKDECLVAIDKPPGMLVHPGREAEGIEWIAMKRLRDQIGRKVFPVHRLDRPTSGVLLFALDKKSAGLVQQAFELRNVGKTYHAIVCGSPPRRWTCEMPLQAGPDDPPLAARTTFERLRETSFPGNPALALSLLTASPASGRFHQIRRHLLAAGFPIVGDFRYAGQDRSHELGRILGTGTRMLLQAKVLELRHPRSGQALRIEAEVDHDFLKCFPCLTINETC